MEINFKTTVKNCGECPFCYYHHEMGGPCGNLCRLREVANHELYPFVKEEGISEGCPFLKKESE